jgi:hypothetical protein
MGTDTQHTEKQYFTTIEELIEKGSGQGSKRSHEQAAALFNDFWQQLGMSLTDQAKASDDQVRLQSIRFLRDAVLPINWYSGKITEALNERNKYIVRTGALLVVIPIVLAAVSAIPKSYVSDAPLIVAQLTGVLTGLVGLQRWIGEALAQQQRYGAWYKASSDLKKLWYGLQSSWLNRGLAKNWPEQREAFLADLADRHAQGRAVVSDEEADFFQKLTLPTVDILSYLSKARTDVSGLLTSLAPVITSAADLAGALLKARQDVAKNDSLIKSYEPEIAAKEKTIKEIADDKDVVKIAAKEALVALQKAKDVAVLAKRTAEAQIASLQVS